jgi:hypothetical protein
LDADHPEKGVLFARRITATLIIGAILIVWGGMAWLLVEEAVRLFN